MNEINVLIEKNAYIVVYFAANKQKGNPLPKQLPLTHKFCLPGERRIHLIKFQWECSQRKKFRKLHLFWFRLFNLVILLKLLNP